MQTTLREFAEAKNISYGVVKGYAHNYGVKPVGRIRFGKCSYRNLFRLEDLERLFLNYRSYNRIMAEKETGRKVPFRNIKCPKYYGCLTTQALGNRDLDCGSCEHRDAVSMDWLHNEMAG